MYNIGIIDIGSNSIRLIVAEIYETQAFKVIYEIKKSVRLAKDMTPSGELNDERVALAIETLKLFKDICGGFEVRHVISVATAAVRTASNQQYFLSRVKSEVGIDIKVLTGTVEAYYDYFGIINSMDVSDCIIMDVGGASAELIWVQDRKLKQSVCFPFGAITLSERFNLLEDSDKERQDLIDAFLLESFKGIPWLKEISELPLIGIGGTMRNIGKIHRKKVDFPLEFIHNYTLDAGEFLDIYDSVKITNLKQRKKVKGLSKDRADIFVGAAAAISCLIRYCSCPALSISGSGVREGLLYEHILKGTNPVTDVLDFSLNSLMHMYGLQNNGAAQIRKLSCRLFEELQPLHEMKTEMLNVLKASSLLYNVGVNIDYYNSSDHSFYMILNSKINGLTDKEKLMAAYAAAILKKDGIEPEFNEYAAILLEKDINTICKLALILKISIDLNLRRNNTVKDLNVKIAEDSVFINLVCTNNAAVEIDTAMAILPDFERLFRKKLMIQQ